MSTENITREGEWMEDKQGLLNPHLNEEPRDWAHFTDSSHRTDSSITSSAESDDDSCDELWTVSDEQRDYYTKQFKTMQTDLTAMISGNVSKQFFEKSGLPIDELSKIWELSDVNRDGALSLDEFWTAMHLVVLRRNNVELPDSLPIQLVPYAPLNNCGHKEDNFSTDRPKGSTIKRISPICDEWAASFSHTPDTSSKTAENLTETTEMKTHISPPPVSSSNPVPNFVTSVSTDSAIVYPIARHHLSPEVVERNPLSPNKFSDESLSSRPRPTPLKTYTAPAFKLDMNTKSRLLPPSSDLSNNSDITHRSHIRSSSLDTHTDTPPVVPPRINREMSHDQHTSNDQKYARSASYDATIDEAPVSLTESTKLSTQNTHSSSIRKQKRRNELINRMNSELNGDLQELMEQRIALEIQLDHLLPYPY